MADRPEGLERAPLTPPPELPERPEEGLEAPVWRPVPERSRVALDRSLPLYQVDAFSDTVFAGNPAAVCLLDAWLPDEALQAIAAENNLSETAFVVRDGARMSLRWFTPREEVPLCGHATLAAGFVVLTFLSPDDDSVCFRSESGDLTVSRRGDRFAIDLPALDLVPVDAPPEPLRLALDTAPMEVLVNHDDPNYFAVFEDQAQVAALRPRLGAVEELHPYGLAVSAPGESTDIVSRYFAPGYGIPEDPVTGSIHCALGPYWAMRLGRPSLTALQLSSRPGRLDVHVEADRVTLIGDAALYLVGEIRAP